MDLVSDLDFGCEISLLPLALSACSSRLGEWISLAEGVMDPLDGGAAVLLPLVSVVSSNVLFGPVNLPLRGFLELLSFPSQNGLRRVLRRRGVCEEMSCWSCQPWLISLVAARAEIAGF